MISVQHFDAMCEQVGWDHAVAVSNKCALNDTYIVALCQIYTTATSFANAIDNDPDAEPFFSIREICINNLRSYYEEND